MLQFLLVRCRRFARPHGSALPLSAGRSPNWNLWSVSWNRLWCGVAMPICGKITRVPELSVEDWVEFASDISCLRSVAHSTVDNPFSPGRRLSVGVVGAFELVTRHRTEPVGAIQPGPDFESDGVLEVACIRANAALARDLAERVATGLNATLEWWG